MDSPISPTRLGLEPNSSFLSDFQASIADIHVAKPVLKCLLISSSGSYGARPRWFLMQSGNRSLRNSFSLEIGLLVSAASSRVLSNIWQFPKQGKAHRPKVRRSRYKAQVDEALQIKLSCFSSFLIPRPWNQRLFWLFTQSRPTRKRGKEYHLKKKINNTRLSYFWMIF